MRVLDEAALLAVQSNSPRHHLFQSQVERQSHEERKSKILQTLQAAGGPAADIHASLDPKRTLSKKNDKLSCYDAGFKINPKAVKKDSLEMRSKVLWKKSLVPKDIDIKLKIPLRVQKMN